MTRTSSTSGAAKVQDRLSSLSPLVRYLLVFGAGLIIGLVLFGWVLFPVRWTQTYPNDLQADVQNDYLLLTAESYNLTGDLDQAVKRLAYWKAVDLMQMANRYADQLLAEGRTQEAERLSALVEDASIYRLSSEPQTEATPAEQSTAAAALDPATQRLLLYLLLGILALAVLLVLMRLLGIPLMGGRQRQEEGPQDEIEGEVLPPTPTRATPSKTSSVYAPIEVEESPLDDEDDRESEDFDDEEPDDTLEGAGEEDDTVEEEEEDLSPPPPAPAAVAATQRRGPTYETLRFDGDPSYNEIRDINERGEYAGEFGMASGKQDPDTPGAVYSMEVWLFDKSDIHTITAVLMHPDSYADENRRQQLAGSYQAIALQNGAPIQLHTKSLELEGRVKKVDFGPTGSKGPTIRHLEVELAGRRR